MSGLWEPVRAEEISLAGRAQTAFLTSFAVEICVHKQNKTWAKPREWWCLYLTVGA